MKTFKIYTFLVFTSLLWHCEQESPNPCSGPTNLDCLNTQLETIKTYSECFPESTFLICGTYEVLDTKFLSAEDFDWIPMICSSPGTLISYRNSDNKETQLSIISKEQHILQSRAKLICEESNEHIYYVCQKNEVASVDFLAPLFGPDTLQLRLSNVII